MLVVRPPLLRRSFPVRAAPFCARPALVSANTGGIAQRLFVVGILGQTLEHSLPDAASTPAGMVRVEQAKISEPLWQTRHGIPARYRYHTASTNSQLSFAVTPTVSLRPGNSVSIFSTGHHATRTVSPSAGPPSACEGVNHHLMPL